MQTDMKQNEIIIYCWSPVIFHQSALLHVIILSHCFTVNQSLK